LSEEKLLRHIKEEAERGLREIRDAAERDAASIRATAQSEVDKVRAQMRREAAAEAERRKARLIAKAKLEARKAVVRAKNELIEKAMTVLEARLKSLRSTDHYREGFFLLATEAAQEMKQAAQAIVAPGDADLCREALKEMGQELDVETSPGLWGGIILTTKDGRERIVNTLNSRYERGREALLGILAEKLFPPDEDK